MAFDDLAKQIFKSKYGDAIETNITSGALEKSFDILIHGKHPAIQDSKYLPDMFKKYECNLIEYKSEHDSYNLFDILKLLGDFGYFCANRQFSISYAFEKCCLWFLISQDSRFKQQLNEESIIQRMTIPGYYHLKNSGPEIIILNLNQLDASDPQNSTLMLLADAKKFQEFIQKNYKEEQIIEPLGKYIKLKFLLEGKKVRNVAEVQSVKNRLNFHYEQGIRESIEELGLDKVIAAVGIDKVIAAVGIDKVIAAVGIDKVIAAVGIDKVIAAVGIDKVIAAVGIDKVIAAVGLKKLIEAIGIKAFAEYIKESSNQKEIEEIISILSSDLKSDAQKKGVSKKSKK